MLLRTALAMRHGAYQLLPGRVGSMDFLVQARLVRCRASSGAGPQEPSTDASDAAKRRERPPPRPIPQGMKLERVERLGDESWAGVAKVDRGAAGSPMGLKDKIILAGGDIGALTIFATIGRASHHEALSVADSLGTAAPFIIGWVGASILLGGYGKGALESPLKTAASAWITGIPTGLVLRSLVKGHVPETTFIAISMAFTGIFLMGWRSAYAKWLAAPGASSAAGNRKGNPFEFFSLLLSLVKRW